MKQVVVGVDGGGSLTRALVADADGHVLSSAEGEGSAVRPGEEARSATVIAGVVRRALAEVPDARAHALCVGVAGVGRATERDALEEALDRLDIAADVVVVPDATIALEDAFGEGSGILLTAGTGSVAFGRGPTGTFARCGGWGPVCGDEGGGAWLGRRALGIVTAGDDGREPDTGLTPLVLAALDLGDIRDLVPWASHATPADLARLAPVVLEVAATGDLRAGSLVSLAIEELGLHVRTLARRLFGDERADFALAFNGGLLARGTLLRKRLEQRLKSMTPGARLHAAEVVAARGAVRRALQAIGKPAARSATPA